MAEQRPMGRMMTDVLIYTLARIALVVVLTVVIFYGAKAFGVQNLPTYVAALFGLVIAMPLGIWLLRPLRQRATASIAVIDEGRRAERERLEGRLRGEDDA